MLKRVACLRACGRRLAFDSLFADVLETACVNVNIARQDKEPDWFPKANGPGVTISCLD